VSGWSALVLAGSRGGADPVAQAAGVSHKAFAEIAGRPMIAHVLSTLAAAPMVGRVAVSIEAGAPPLPGDAAALRLDAAASPALSALDGFDRLGAPLLIVTADHPLMTQAMLADFLAAATASGAAVAAAVARRSVIERGGPGPRRTWLRFSDGAASGCNMFAVMRPEGRAAIAFWRRLEAQRKNPLAMARTLGPLTLARYALGALSAAAAARALGRAAGCAAALVALDHPDAAHDVDKASDLAFARRRLTQGGG